MCTRTLEESPRQGEQVHVLRCGLGTLDLFVESPLSFSGLKHCTMSEQDPVCQFHWACESKMAYFSWGTF